MLRTWSAVKAIEDRPPIARLRVERTVPCEERLARAAICRFGCCKISETTSSAGLRQAALTHAPLET